MTLLLILCCLEGEIIMRCSAGAGRTGRSGLFSQVFYCLQVFLNLLSNDKTTLGALSSHRHSDAIMSSKMVVMQPQPVMVTQDSEQWGSGICDCWQDKRDCCFAYWCCPCFACVTAKKYGQCLCLPLLDVFGFIPPINLSMRVSMRQHYGIKDTICRDCLYATFCVPCSWCQMAREMKRRNIPIVLVSAKNT